MWVGEYILIYVDTREHKLLMYLLLNNVISTRMSRAGVFFFQLYFIWPLSLGMCPWKIYDQIRLKPDSSDTKKNQENTKQCTKHV